ncbi:hypothetical protein [Butyrivibrio sp. NC3005]|nr:hypothetical protein [Butyrivibrio sp. NC3005]
MKLVKRVLAGVIAGALIVSSVTVTVATFENVAVVNEDNGWRNIKEG